MLKVEIVKFVVVCESVIIFVEIKVVIEVVDNVSSEFVVCRMDVLIKKVL